MWPVEERLDCMDRDFLLACLGEGLSLEQIAERAGRHPSTVAYHLKKHGLVASGHEVHAPNRRIDPNRLRALLAEGATIREAATAFGVGYSTIRHWVQRLGLRTERMIRMQESRAAAMEGAARIVLRCARHGEAAHFRRGDGGYRCAKCRSEAVSRRRRIVKQKLVERAGGCCQICGYARYPGALHFHHADPASKSFLLSRNGVTRSLSEAEAEADKCVLLCGNCHAEVEAGVTGLPEALTLKLPNDGAS